MMITQRNTLVAIDVKHKLQSEMVLSRAIELAATRSATLTILHIVEADVFSISSEIASKNAVWCWLKEARESRGNGIDQVVSGCAASTC
jgi:nucleotide-binding universal stress UspA family protein